MSLRHYTHTISVKYKIENAITCAIHFFDKTTLTNPGPAKEHESIISDMGRLLMIAYTKTHTDYHLITTNQNLIPKSAIH